MSAGLKLTCYFGERDRIADRFVADALLDVFERRRLRASVLLRGIEGFGARQHLHSERSLTLSEDLPLVAVAVDETQRVEAALAEVAALRPSGLVTLERARLLGGPDRGDGTPDREPQEEQEAKLTVYCGRGQRAGGGPAHRAVVDLLRAHGVAGATVLLGVDGTTGGVRRRARFFGANADVPLMIIAVGDGARVRETIPELTALLPAAPVTLERVHVSKRDGRSMADPVALPESDASGLEVWQKLTLFAGEHARHDGHPLHLAVVQRLRAEGAAGATALRGLWGYHGDHPPHGDTVWSIARRAPVVTVIVDRPPRARRWFALLDTLTGDTGLVTSEMVPSLRPAALADSARLARLD